MATRLRALILLAGLLLLLLTGGASLTRSPLPLSTAHAADGVATLTVFSDRVTLVATDGSSRAAASGDEVRAGERILTDTTGRALLTLADGSEMEIDVQTDVRVETLQSGDGGSVTSLGQNAGVTVSRVAHLGSGSSYQVNTPSATALVRGTEFSTRVVNPNGNDPAPITQFSAKQGTVEIQAGGTITFMGPGESVVVTPPGPGVEKGTGHVLTSTESGVVGGSFVPGQTNGQPAGGETNQHENAPNDNGNCRGGQTTPCE